MGQLAGQTEPLTEAEIAAATSPDNIRLVRAVLEQLHDPEFRRGLTRLLENPASTPLPKDVPMSDALAPD